MNRLPFGVHVWPPMDGEGNTVSTGADAWAVAPGPNGTVHWIEGFSEGMVAPTAHTVDATGHELGTRTLPELGQFCRSYAFTRDGSRQFAVLRLSPKPAEGVIAATYDVDVLFLDENLAVTKTVNVVKGKEGEPSCLSHETLQGTQDVDTRLSNLGGEAWTLSAPSADGKWMVVSGNDRQTDTARGTFIDTSTGAKTPAEGTPYQVLGNALIQKCPPSKGGAEMECLATPTDPAGVPTSAPIDASQDKTGICRLSNYSCRISQTGDPHGVVVTSRVGGGVELVSSTTGKTIAAVPGAGFVTSAVSLDDGKVLVLASDSSVVGVSPEGRKLWTLGGATACGVADEGAVLKTKDQMAIVDASGKQVTYGPWQYECPRVLGSFGFFRSRSAPALASIHTGPRVGD